MYALCNFLEGNLDGSSYDKSESMVKLLNSIMEMNKQISLRQIKVISLSLEIFWYVKIGNCDRSLIEELNDEFERKLVHSGLMPAKNAKELISNAKKGKLTQDLDLIMRIRKEIVPSLDSLMWKLKGYIYKNSRCVTLPKELYLLIVENQKTWIKKIM